MSSFAETLDPLLEQAKSIYREKFQLEPSTQVFAPGRCNLIGEHVDYNDGFVLPFALPFKTVIVGSVGTGGESKVYSSLDGVDASLATFTISAMDRGEPEWANYIKGTITQYLRDLPSDAAISCVIVSNVPVGAGLSSSAALEVAIATFLETAFILPNISGVTKALRCQKAEHTWADTPCGIMDQYISAMGQDGNLLLIDCRR
jgi:galactokinase